MNDKYRQYIEMECERRHKDNILNNIVREVDAIRGYLIDPVEGDYILDEIEHIEELCAELRVACYGEPAAQDDPEPEDGEGDDEEFEPDDDEDDQEGDEDDE